MTKSLPSLGVLRAPQPHTIDEVRNAAIRTAVARRTDQRTEIAAAGKTIADGVTEELFRQANSMSSDEPYDVDGNAIVTLKLGHQHLAGTEPLRAWLASPAEQPVDVSALLDAAVRESLEGFEVRAVDVLVDSVRGADLPTVTVEVSLRDPKYAEELPLTF
ncbi:MAG: hypothetical protein IPJ65_22075 [Archangiaceae bacterium]|nr:hypothetical protein [Archangiaceae bacterium]